MTSSYLPARPVYYDAGLILQFGFNPPVGLVRVEQYVAEFLKRQSAIDLRFVIFDRYTRAYRPLSTREQKLLLRILFDRYRQAAAGRLGTARGDPPAVRRFSRMLSGAWREARRKIRRKVRKKAGKLDRWLEARDLAFARQILAKIVGSPCAFTAGDVLVVIGNAWDYMDYGYLTRIVRQNGVRLIAAIHDVIAMELPFTPPEAVHFYHRHWVELGHLAAHLVAISRYSLDSYRRLIALPNDLDPAMSYAYLPNFLQARSAEIGERAVPELLDRRFVVFCSTIETRKNHQLLLHAWDRLRQEIDPEKLPVLVFVGQWGWGTETVRLMTERNWRLREHLKILTGISDAELIWLYRNARFTVFPAFAEGFGLAAAESLSFGTPVVVSRCPALMEASEGLMPAIDPMDLPSWLAELRRLILDEACLDALRVKAGQYRGADYDAFALAILDAVRGAPARTGVFGKERLIA